MEARCEDKSKGQMAVPAAGPKRYSGGTRRACNCVMAVGTPRDVRQRRSRALERAGVEEGTCRSSSPLPSGGQR